MTDSIALDIKGVSRATQSGFALHGINATFCSSERVLVLGHNGAGKSTFLRLLSGLSSPNLGTIHYSIGAKKLSRKEIWSCLGYLSHNLQLYSQLTVYENISLFLALRDRTAQIDLQLEKWGLESHRNKQIAELSKGLQVRVALAVTFAHSPRIVLLDEPSSSLDEDGAQLVCSALEEREGKTGAPALSLIASHDISRFFPICNRIVVFEQGRLTFDSQSLTQSVSIEEAKEAVVGRYRRSNR